MTNKEKKTENPPEYYLHEIAWHLHVDAISQPDPEQQWEEMHKGDEPHSPEVTRSAVLEISERAQLAAAARLSARAFELLQQPDPKGEQAPELAIILRALAAHSQAEAIAELAAAPDLAELLDGQGDEEDGDELPRFDRRSDRGDYLDSLEVEEGDEWEGGGDAY